MQGNFFIIDVFIKGGLVMIPILLCSILATAVIISRIRFFTAVSGNPELFMKKVRAALSACDFAEAMRICRREPHPVAEVIAAGIDHLDQPREYLLDRMRQEALRQLKRVERNNGILATIAGISPLLGLTGTVMGMISSFSIITTVGVGDPSALAGGISEALYATASGLFVGIPSLVAHNWCESKVAEFESSVEYCTLDLVNHIPNPEVIREKAAA
ncbi:MAG: MotA/TolQ/ExbB proton channel family protein [Candidatus Riflebacteria bacterium]|nr:MotA/TolQ/ExbB proton channel family protein [Candidatus Riflebacteria bacterium]